MGKTWAGRLALFLGIVGFPLIVSADGPATPPAPAAAATPAPALPPAAEAIADPEATPIDTAQMRAELTEKLKESTDKTGKDGSPAMPKPLRDLLEERLKLLGEWDKAYKSRQEAEHPKKSPEQQISEIKAELARVQSTLDKSAKDTSIILPAAFRQPAKDLGAVSAEMKECIDAAKAELKDWKNKFEKIRSAEASRTTTSSIAALRNQRDKLQQSVASLAPRRKEIEAAVTEAKSPDEQALANERLATFELESKVEVERLLGQEARISLEMKRISLPDLEKKTCEAHIELTSKSLSLMQAKYQALANVVEQNLKKNADVEQDIAARSNDPLVKYQARCKAQLLELQAQVVKHENVLASSISPSPEEQRILGDRAVTDFQSIKQLLDDGRISHLDAMRFNNDFRRIRPERARIVSRELATAEALQAHFENLLSSVELELLQDQRIDQYEHETLLEQLPPEKHGKAKALFAEIDKQHLELLNKNRAILMRLAARAEQTQKEIVRRLDILDEQYGFIRTHIFWVRDQEPLGFSTLLQAQRGTYVIFKGLFRLALELGDRSLWGRISAEFVTATAFLAILPWPFFRLRQFLRARPQAAEGCVPNTWSLNCYVLLFGIASATIWPGYLLLLAYTTRQAPWPRNIAIPVATALLMLTPAMVFLSFMRWFLRHEGWAERQLSIPAEVTRQLRRAVLMLVCIGSPLAISQFLLDQNFVAPGGRPISAPSVTRLLGLGIEILLMYVVFYLTRGNSAFIQWLLQLPQRLGWISRRRREICLACLFGLGGIIALDVCGYSFTAQRLTMAIGQGMLLIGICFLIYRTLIRLIDQHAWRWIRMGPTLAVPAAQKDPSAPDDLANRLRRLVAFAMPVVGLFIAAWIWSIDWALFEFVSNIQLVSGDEKTAITIGNAFECLVILGVTSFVWHHTSTLFAVAIFPRMSEDPGIRFAVVTLSRYAVLAVGLLSGLSAVHLGLEKIGMVLAALGVGLGFGLQEIVSNFVCGIILLLERPIRVGDTVTVSGMIGTVDRINIRATTIINGDNQSIIVPNRAFITSDLVNWTLKDKIVRVTIRVRAARGSDPDKVSELLLRIAREDADVLRNPIPSSFMEDFSDWAQTFVLFVHVPEPSLAARVKHRLFAQIQKKFAESSIDIAMPTHELRLHSIPEASNHLLNTGPEVVRKDGTSVVPPAPKFVTPPPPIPAPLEECHRGMDE